MDEHARRQARQERRQQEEEAEKAWIEKQRQRAQATQGGSQTAEHPTATATATQAKAAPTRAKTARHAAGKTGSAAAARQSPRKPTPAGKRPRPAGKGKGKRPGTAKAKAKAKAKAASPQTKPAGKKAPIKTTASRAFLESSEMDLFEKGRDPRLTGCPQCQHELTKIVHIEREVRVCFHCRGVFLPYTAWREFGAKSDWFLQLGPAIRRHRERTKKPKP